MLKSNQKLEITFDNSRDNTDVCTKGYYIVVVMEYDKDCGWVNSGKVFHVEELGDLDELLNK